MLSRDFPVVRQLMPPRIRHVIDGKALTNSGMGVIRKQPKAADVPESETLPAQVMPAAVAADTSSLTGQAQIVRAASSSLWRCQRS